jgi:uncharacterized protein GlcG (DUF336 family)
MLGLHWDRLDNRPSATVTRMTAKNLHTQLNFVPLENREVPASAVFDSGVLTILGTAQADRIVVELDMRQTNIEVRDAGRLIASVNARLVTDIVADLQDGKDRLQISPQVMARAGLRGGAGTDTLIAGGGITILVGDEGNNKLIGGRSTTTFVGGSGRDMLVGGRGTNLGTTGSNRDQLIRVSSSSLIQTNEDSRVLLDNPTSTTSSMQETLTTDDVETLLLRATAASASQDAIIVIVDRNGLILGARVESGVAPEIQNDTNKLVFAVDGAVSLARTGAYFGNNQAPLTSRTVGFISQSTVTQREVESNPNILDLNSTDRGPGYVAAVRAGGHFPPGIQNTPPVDLFGIEHTNRDSLLDAGADGIKGTSDDVMLPARFNTDPQFISDGQSLVAPESYGFSSGLLSTSQSRGIGTLPGGIPIYKNGQVVGGIGVFFPGKTGFATEMNSSLSNTFDPTKPDRSVEAEYIAFAALGGSSTAVSTTGVNATIGNLGGIDALPGFDLPFGRIDLVGITLDIFGPGGNEGITKLVNYGKALGQGDANAGRFLIVNPGADSLANTSDDITLLNGNVVPEGWLVNPHDGVGITAAQVESIVEQGIQQANQTRAAIRLPLNSTARMVFAVADQTGEIVGLYRMPDATVFSIDVAVAKARNVNYYADANKLQAEDSVVGVVPGTAFSNRTFRYLALPRFASGAIEGSTPGVFSIFMDGGSDPLTGLQVGPRLPASAYQSVYGYDSFNPGTNFHDRTNTLNQNGIVFFPGSSPLYGVNAAGNGTLIGGFGVSGDGVDQDDVVTALASDEFDPTGVGILRADQQQYLGVRLPYQKFNRNPEGGLR